MQIDFQGHSTFIGTGGADWQEGRASLVLQHGAGMDRTVAAQAKPSVAESLILFGAAYPMPVGAPLLDASSRNEQAAIDMITFYSHSFSSRLGHNPIAGINVYNTADALLRRAAPGVLHTDLQACNQFALGDQALRELGTQLQCSLISGAEDRMTPAKFSTSLAEALSAEVFMLEDCGHMMMGEQPEACLQAMMKALSRLND